MTDKDKAERNALFRVFWNGMLEYEATAMMEGRLNDLQAFLEENGLLGTDLRAVTLNVQLPIRGLNKLAGTRQRCACINEFAVHLLTHACLPLRLRANAAHHGGPLARAPLPRACHGRRAPPAPHRRLLQRAAP
jgi:hypothetical protein